MLKTTFLSILLAGTLMQANAQNLYMPRDIKLAYQKAPGQRTDGLVKATGRTLAVIISVSPPFRPAVI